MQFIFRRACCGVIAGFWGVAVCGHFVQALLKPLAGYLDRLEPSLGSDLSANFLAKLLVTT